MLDLTIKYLAVFSVLRGWYFHLKLKFYRFIMLTVVKLKDHSVATFFGVGLVLL